MNDYIKIELPPREVGGYCIGKGPFSLTFMLTRKPNVFHRFFVKLILGWTWRDVPTVTKE